MLLRIIKQHMQNGNWFVVLVDFAIVVAVFIGIQVTNWNETQSYKAGLGNHVTYSNY